MIKRLARALIIVAPLAFCGAAEGHAVETISTDAGRFKIKKVYKNGATVKFCISKSISTKGPRLLKLLDNSGSGIVVIEVSDSTPGPLCATFNRKDLMNGFRFELYKRTFLVFNSYLAGTDVTYPGEPPLDQMDFHWLDGK